MRKTVQELASRVEAAQISPAWAETPHNKVPLTLTICSETMRIVRDIIVLSSFDYKSPRFCVQRQTPDTCDRAG